MKFLSIVYGVVPHLQKSSIRILALFVLPTTVLPLKIKRFYVNFVELTKSREYEKLAIIYHISTLFSYIFSPGCKTS